jgi:hypothetical protein
MPVFAATASREWSLSGIANLASLDFIFQDGARRIHERSVQPTPTR